MNDIFWKSASALGRAFARRDLSPVELTQQVLARAERLQPHLNFLVLIDREGALVEARQSEARWRRREPLSPLDGVPTSIKDTTTVKGWPTRIGSHATDETPAPEDAPVVARLRAAGLPIIGKSTTPEFGWKALTDSPLQGVTRSPWNLGHTPGGSSGGASSMTAAGIAAFNHGNDGGGSIRIPAAHTGLVGLKPSFGRIAQYPADSAFADVVSQGVLARSVLDTALVLNATPTRATGGRCRPRAATTQSASTRVCAAGASASASISAMSTPTPRCASWSRRRHVASRCSAPMSRTSAR